MFEMFEGAWCQLDAWFFWARFFLEDLQLYFCVTGVRYHLPLYTVLPNREMPLGTQTVQLCVLWDAFGPRICTYQPVELGPDAKDTDDPHLPIWKNISRPLSESWWHTLFPSWCTELFRSQPIHQFQLTWGLRKLSRCPCGTASSDAHCLVIRCCTPMSMRSRRVLRWYSHGHENENVPKGDWYESYEFS